MTKALTLKALDSRIWPKCLSNHTFPFVFWAQGPIVGIGSILRTLLVSTLRIVFYVQGPIVRVRPILSTLEVPTLGTFKIVVRQLAIVKSSSTLGPRDQL